MIAAARNIINRSKFIFITGGVISSIGKGITTSYIGAVLKSYGYNVTAIKIDPYINIDAGTFSPFEHGEVFVLDDGGEVDLDLGNYERVLNVSLTKDNNITTGKIYDLAIRKERGGEYLGETVQIIPHITDLIQDWILNVGNKHISEVQNSNVCLVEVGGVLGDFESMPFLEAIRQFQRRLKRTDCCNIHVSLLPQTIDGEAKTKPTQMSVKQMRSLGLYPDFIICRSLTDINLACKNKISLFCDTPVSNIIGMPNFPDVCQMFKKFIDENIVECLSKRLELISPVETPLKDKWLEFCQRSITFDGEIKIAIVGKYSSHPDAYYSIKYALYHASVFLNKSLKIEWVQSDKLEEDYKKENETEYYKSWNQVKSSSAIVIPGGFDKRGCEGMILVASYARTNKVPLLGICLGFQIMAIEFARSHLKLIKANSIEIDPSTPDPIIIEMPEFNPEQKGGTMRLGLRQTNFKNKDCHSFRMYNNQETIFERHRHRYEFNTKYKKDFEEKGFVFVGEDVTGTRMEIAELNQKNHPFYVGVQFHPEFLSRPLDPAPLFIGLVVSAINNQRQN